MKLFFRRIHLYLGLVSGLFLVVVCLTGSILVFEEELEHAFHRERYVVEAATTPRLSLAQLTAAVRAAKPKARINGFKVYADPTRTVEVNLGGAGRPGGPQGEPRGAGMASQAERQGQRGGERSPAGGPAKGGPGKGDRGPTLFLNPYTGAVLGEFNKQQSFFHFIEEIHRGLVAGRVGKLVMGINSSIFVFILGTGLVLWWPATRRALSSRLRVKWDASWKRVTYDWHTALGFYSSVFLLIMALTGVGMAFDWVGKGINTLTHSPQQRPEPPTSTLPAGLAPAAFGADAALALARQQAPDAKSYILQLPKAPDGSVQVGILRPGALMERATDDVYLDQYTGQVLRQQAYAEKPVGQRIRGLFKPIHTGAIFGWPTKVLAFVVVLLGATFPITGTLMWLNRTRKSRKKSVPRVAVA
ncbi:PepSY domain-containing protein [Hymenobacter sp. BT559]|uniref:PepSY-associated TM helix domain-containing protein n=1 Tax=Hymenobacter sp. BT559 TaxID=2795729 RepID=UPI0018ED5064|nr:PepSY-associated TM helix domain-containing protein [Hymenobacter sp. BT559]MBJ6144911.1 PepSY domain-containing protein [Hymenobacter sp. BT559]